MATSNDVSPIWFTPFIGREREKSQICSLLSRDDVRLVTLTGPGGVGKTRLARAAGERAAHASGRRLTGVDLSPITDPGLVLQAIAQSLGLRDTGCDSLANQIAADLSERPVLLLLDNFEQVIEAASLLVPLLVASPALQILVTSREQLRLSAEHAFEVPPLTLPDEAQEQTSETLAQCESVRLFVERAVAASHEFALNDRNAGAVAEICRRLDGLPLAIELAAARAKALPPAALLERLDHDLPVLTAGPRDQPARQRTLGDAIGWSYDLLSKQEQALFRRLSIFAGGFTLSQADVLGTPLPVLAGVLSLVDKSLLRSEERSNRQSRFRMLATVRAYGLERLAEAGELGQVRDQHAALFLELAESRDPTIPIPGDFAWTARLTPDQDNLRLALLTLYELGDWPRLLRLAVALDDFWQILGQYDEANRWIRLALEREPTSPPTVRVKALAALGQLAYFRGNYSEAHSYWEQELELAHAAGLEYAVADKLARLGALASRDGDLDRAASLLTEAHTRFVGLNPDGTPALRMIGRILDLLGDTAILQGNFDTAAEHYAQAIKQLRATNDPWMLVDALGGLGVVELMRGDPVHAGILYLEALQIGSSAYNVQHNTGILTGLTAVAGVLGQPERAGRLLGAADALRERLGAVVYPRDRVMLERCMAILHAELDDETLTLLREEGSRLSPDQLLAEARAIVETSYRATALKSANHPFGLTSRELDVLRLLIERRTDREIAEMLFISRRTVTTHTSSIFAKLGVSNRYEAAAIAVRRDLA